MSVPIRSLLSAFVLIASCARGAPAPVPLDLTSGDRVVFLGDAFVEQEQHHGWIEVMLTTRFAERDITFRNLGWSGDTPAGDSRFGLSLLQAGREPADEGWNQLVKQIREAAPTVVFAAYGMSNSFDGAAGLGKFRSDYTRLLDTVATLSPAPRVVLLSPIRHEDLGAPWPAAAPHNAQLAEYARAVADIARERNLPFVSLFDALRGRMESAGEKLTHNGIQLTGPGYRAVAELLEHELFGAAGPWRTSPQTEPLRQAILRKSEWFFHRSRPANMAYIFGFRRREQGRNAGEITRFDELIAAEEKRIAQLRPLRPAHVPGIPRRVGSAAARFTPQPHPAFQLPDGLELTVWAENPLLNKPIQMNFDPQGRLWVVSSELYPQIEPGQAATDRVIVLEDTTGGGQADRATVFADGLLIPTGIEVGGGGAYVAQSTELLHFRDTDGDGKADIRRTVLSGFGTEDTHHNLHTLRWGPDGRLYMNQSVYTRTDAETPHGVVRLKAGGVFRLDPRDQRLEVLYRGLVNGWGQQWDDFGESFLTDGAGFQGISWGVPGATYLTLAPARRTIDSVSPGRYPKFCGIEVLRSPLFPADWQGDVITLDYRAHRVVRFKFDDQGAGFVTKEMPDLVRTTADSFRPIDVRLGPDGALYIADWSNPIIQHGEVDFRDPRRDKAHGRIWRLAPKGAATRRATDFTKLGNPELLDRLLSRSSYDQEQARRVLVERGADRVRPDLDRWTDARRSDVARLRAFELYHAFNHDTPELLDALLGSGDPRIRAAAVRALPPGAPIERLAKLAGDDHPRVRLAAVRALGRSPSVEAAEIALRVLDRPMDPFLEYAVWLTMNDVAEPWLAAVKAGGWQVAGREKHLEFALKAIAPEQASEVLGQLLGGRGVPRDGSGPWIELIGAAGGAAELGQLFGQLLRGELPAPAAHRAFSALADAARLRSAQPAGDLVSLDPLLGAGDGPTRIAAIRLAGTWKLRPLTMRLVTVAGAANTPAAERAAAFEALRDIGGPAVIAQLQKLARAHDSADIRREATVTLAAVELPTAMPDIIAVLKATTDETKAQALWRTLLGIRGVSNRLAAELPKAGLPREVARAGLRPAREGNQHQALVPVLLKAAGLSLATVQLSSAELQAMAREALAKGDAARGEEVYRRADLACVACHAIGGAGGKLGPDLTSIGASAQPDYLVESLLYPSAKIKEGYHSVAIATADGQEHSGMIARETPTEIVLRNAANQDVSIPARSVARRTNIGSLMPAGLIDTLVPEERLDLVRFMAQLGKPGEYDAAKGGVARAWKLYMVTSQNQHLGHERVVAGDFTLTDWAPAFSLVRGALPKGAIETAFPNRFNNRGIFAATRFEAPRDGTVRFRTEGNIRGIWVNGTPVPAGGEFMAAAKAGVNTIVVQIEDAQLSDVALRSGEVTFVMD